MERSEKQTAVDALKGKLSKAQSVILVDFRGLTVEADNKLRREFRESGCEYRVVKNTIVGLAVKGTPMEAVDGLLKGPTAIAYSFEDPAAPAKVATKVAKDQDKFVIKGGYVDGRVLDKTGVAQLSTLPGKDEVRASLLATMLAVPQSFMRLLIAAPMNFLYLVQAREREQGGGDKQG